MIGRLFNFSRDSIECRGALVRIRAQYNFLIPEADNIYFLTINHIYNHTINFQEQK